MSTWYFVDRGNNRQGPVDADGLAEAHRQGRLDYNSLVWREGMAEWAPLGQFQAELNLRPPSAVPPGMAAPATEAPAAKKGGCGIVAIVAVCVGAVLIPILAILAAIALPAYQDYIARSHVHMVLADLRAHVMSAEEFHANTGRCPRDADEIGMPEEIVGGDGRRRTLLSVDEPAPGRCELRGQLGGASPVVEGAVVRLTRGEDGLWACTAEVRGAKYLPSGCGLP